MRLGLLCLVALSACSKTNSAFNTDDLSVSSDDLSTADDGGGGGDGGDGGGDGGDGGGIVCVNDQPCFTGTDPSKRSVGSCRDGIRNCVNGMLGACSGEVLPSSESCNNLDDDCDGTVDNGLGNLTCGVGACARPIGAVTPVCVNGAPNPTACVPGIPTVEICNDGIDQDCDGVADDGCNCIYVAPRCAPVNPAVGCFAAAADNGTCGTAGAPCATVKYAIENRASSGGPNTVCVASLANCSGTGARTAFNFVESAITMRNGISVQGGYDLMASPSPSPRPTACVTRISVSSHNAVTFPDTVTTPTTLDGVEIVNTDTTDNITTGVAVLGSTGAIISNSYIFGGGGTAESHGVRIASTATTARPLLTRNAIVGGTSPLAIGISSTNAVPTIRAHCDTINGASGRCNSSSCNPGGGARVGLGFIHGRSPGGATRTNAYGILLTNSPGAIVESSGIFGSQCALGLLTNGDVAGVRITGDASGTVLRGNFISALQAGANAVGVWADQCAGTGASLWIFNNERITGNSPQLSCFGDGVRAEGNCHPRIDSNALVRGGEEGSVSPANGVNCRGGSQCTILRNTQIEGSSSGNPPSAAGVRCGDASCGRIEGNRITGRAGGDTFGIILGATGVLVSTNLIDAGCSLSGQGVGVESLSSFARLQNNVIRGVVCANTSTANSWGLRDAPGAGSNEIDVNGNDLLGMGDPNGGSCASQAIGILNRGAGGARGVYRNNLLHAGFCPTSYDVNEEAGPTVARVFKHNDLWHTGTPSALYYSAGAALLTTISGVNLLTDPASNSNFEADPLFTNPSPIVFPMPATPNYHLQSMSPCIDKGVTVPGGPTTDYDNPGNLSWQSAGSLKTRNTPDVGADETQ